MRLLTKIERKNHDKLLYATTPDIRAVMYQREIDAQARGAEARDHYPQENYGPVSS